jgi:hypothetical protein
MIEQLAPRPRKTVPAQVMSVRPGGNGRIIICVETKDSVIEYILDKRSAGLLLAVADYLPRRWPMIEPLSRAERSILKSYRLGCIYVTAKGAIGTGTDLAHADRPAAAWWCSSRAAAESVLVAIGAYHPSLGRRCCPGYPAGCRSGRRGPVRALHGPAARQGSGMSLLQSVFEA